MSTDNQNVDNHNLVISIQQLEDVIRVIYSGLELTVDDISFETREMLYQWCMDKEKILKSK